MIQEIDNLVEIDRSIKTRTTPNISNVSGAYVILHEKTNRIYVGSSGNLALRINAQLSTLRKNKNKNKNLQKAWNDDPNVKVFISETEDRVSAFQKEQEIVDANKTIVFNVAVENVMSPGQGIEKSEETKRKVSQSLTGHVVTEDTRLKISAGNRGKIHDPRVREQQSKTKREHPDFETRRLKQIENKQDVSKKVTINGIVYQSLHEASRCLGIDKTTIKRRAANNNPKFDTYSFS